MQYKSAISFIVAVVWMMPLFAQNLTLEQIKINLLNNPPNTGDPAVREETILALDSILKHDSSRTSQSVADFYTFMMEKVETELHDTCSVSAIIWMMYNHGFIIKTPEVVFAFDLVNGYHEWSTNLPAELIAQIQVLFISHQHIDHYDSLLANTVMANNGYVVYPSEDSSAMGNVPLSTGDSLTLLELQIKAHDGDHNVPVRMYEVTTPHDFKLLHTGDSWTSISMPEIDNLDVLLLNAWIIEDGTTNPVTGMRNCIDVLNPTVMIPGHIQELGHNHPWRFPYEWVFEVDDIPLTTAVQVMAWGERYFVSKELVGPIEPSKDSLLLKSFALYQNYPNPFNRTSTINYFLPEAADVTLTIYDILGREISRPINGHVEPGYHEVIWDARDQAGRAMPSGIYITYLITPENTKSIKLVLLK